MIESGGIFLLFSIIVSFSLGVIGWFFGRYLIYLWNKNYSWRKGDPIFLVAFCMVISVFAISLFSLNFSENAKLSIYNKLWYNEIIVDLSWQREFKKLDEDAPDEEAKLLSFTKRSLSELKKKASFTFMDFKERELTKEFVEKSVELINTNNKYYKINSFRPKDGLKVLKFFIKSNASNGSRVTVYLVIIVFFLFSILGALVMSPVVLNAYKQLKVNK